MNEKKKTLNAQTTKAILFGLLVLLPFALYLSMGIPMLSYLLFGLLVGVFAAIAILN